MSTGGKAKRRHFRGNAAAGLLAGDLVEVIICPFRHRHTLNALHRLTKSQDGCAQVLTNQSAWVIICTTQGANAMAKFTKNYGSNWALELTPDEHRAVQSGNTAVTVYMADGSKKTMTVTRHKGGREHAGKQYHGYEFIADERKPVQQAKPTPQPRKEAPVIPANAQSIQRRSAGKADGYEVGAIMRLGNVAGGGGPDGHYFRVISASKYRDDDYDEWYATAYVVPATDAEAAPVAERIARKAAAKAEAEALMRALGASKSASMHLDQEPAGAMVTLWEDRRAAGSEAWIAIGQQVYYTQSSYDDGPRWWATSATIEQVEQAKATGLIRPNLLWSK
jgi:hypothetical protein